MGNFAENLNLGNRVRLPLVLRMVQYGALTFCIVTISHTPEGVYREIKVRHRADILLLKKCCYAVGMSNDCMLNFTF